MAFIDSLEKYLILGTKPQIEGIDLENIPEKCTLVLNGQYENALQCEAAVSLLKGDNCIKDLLTPETLSNFIKENVLKYLLSDSDDAKIRCLDVLQVAIACLQLFVQSNWTGPKLLSHPVNFLPSCFQEEKKKEELHEYVINCLSSDGESLYELVVSPEYLFIARVILTECRQQLQLLQTADWWLLRCMRLQQEYLDDKSPTIKSMVMEIIDKVEKQGPVLLHPENNRSIEIAFHLEAGHMCHLFYEYRRAKVHFESAEKSSGLKVHFTGALGKRTRFQQEDKPQLVLVVEREHAEFTKSFSEGHKIDSLLPKDLALNDDTVLESVKFQHPEDVSMVTVSDIESVLLIGLIENHRRTNAAHETAEEELLAFIAAVLSQPRVWSVQVSALFLRSKLQKNSSRRVDRSMRQLEDLINLYDATNLEASKRLEHFYATRTPSITNMQTELARLLMSLGAFGSACDVFEKLKKWDDVIHCYQRIGKTEKAETLIRDQLAIKETPNLYCFLGDVTKEMEYYEKAWELSNHHSARAQRCLGYLYMGKQQFEKSLPCFEKSLDINGLQIPVWFTYGCAAMAATKYDIAAKAFHRCVTLDYDNYEAWANLSTCYVRLGQKPRAFAILQDAIKCNYDNWRLWENCLIIGLDCKEFNEVINSYNRLLDLKDKHTDAEVLVILSAVIRDNIPDVNGTPAGHLRQKALELFGRVSSQGITNGEIWEAYADLTQIDEDDQAKEKSLQYLKKAHQYSLQDNNWEKDVKKCFKNAKLSLKLAEAYSACLANVPAAQSLPLVSSAKLMLRNCAVKIKQQQIPIPEDLREIYQSLEDQTEKFIQLQNQLKAS